jgi:SOS response regulatory protein OraA/RecX
LKQRALKTDIIQDCLGQIEPRSEFAIAMKLVNTRYKKLSITDYPKVARFLANRGFSNTTTSQIIEQLFSDT